MAFGSKRPTEPTKRRVCDPLCPLCNGTTQCGPERNWRPCPQSRLEAR